MTLIIVAVLTIIFLFLLVWYKGRIYSSILNGTWISTNEFNDKSGITSMILTIDAPSVDIIIYRGEEDRTGTSGTYSLDIGTDFNIFNIEESNFRIKTDIDFMTEDMLVNLKASGYMYWSKDDDVYFEGARF